MRVTCFQCEKRTGSYQYAEHDDEGHGTHPMCDQCAGLYEAPTVGVNFVKPWTIIT